MSTPKLQEQRVALGSSHLEQGRGWWVTSGMSTPKPHGLGVALGSSTLKTPSLGAEQGQVGSSHPKPPGAEGDTRLNHPKIPWSCVGGCGWHWGARK